MRQPQGHRRRVKDAEYEMDSTRRAFQPAPLGTLRILAVCKAGNSQSHRGKRKAQEWNQEQRTDKAPFPHCQRRKRGARCIRNDMADAVIRKRPARAEARGKGRYACGAVRRDVAHVIAVHDDAHERRHGKRPQRKRGERHRGKAHCACNERLCELRLEKARRRRTFQEGP